MFRKKTKPASFVGNLSFLSNGEEPILAWHPSRMQFWHVFLQHVIALSCTRSVLSQHSPWFFRKEYSIPISEHILSLVLVHVAGLRHTKKSLSQAVEAPRAWNDLYSSSVPWVNCTGRFGPKRSRKGEMKREAWSELAHSPTHPPGTPRKRQRYATIAVRPDDHTMTTRLWPPSTLHE